MRIQRTRSADQTFELNLAPMLDIIVSIVPMLLLGVAFLEIKMIESTVPQIVTEAMQKENDNKDPEVSVKLKISKTAGFVFEVDNKGKKSEMPVALKGKDLDYESLQQMAYGLKKQFPTTFKLALSPDAAVTYEEIVLTMDSVRQQKKGGPKIALRDEKTGQNVETDLLFPNVSFGNVVGE